MSRSRPSVSVGHRDVAVAGGSAGVGFQCGLGGGVGDVGCDVVEDAGAEFAQQGGVELPGPVDEHTDGLVGGLGAGGRVHGGDGVGDDPGLVHGDAPVGQRVAHAGVAGVQSGGEIDQPAGGGNGEPQSLAQPDRGAGRALRDRGASTVDLTHQRQLDGGETLLQAVRGVERRDQLIARGGPRRRRRRRPRPRRLPAPTPRP